MGGGRSWDWLRLATAPAAASSRAPRADEHLGPAEGKTDRRRKGVGVMKTAQDYKLQGAYDSVSDEAVTRGVGWVTFAAIMRGFGGTWNVIAGILGISSSRVYTDSSVFIFSDLNTWGWIVLGLGIIQGL